MVLELQLFRGRKEGVPMRMFRIVAGLSPRSASGARARHAASPGRAPTARSSAWIRMPIYRVNVVARTSKAITISIAADGRKWTCAEPRSCPRKRRRQCE